MFFPESVSTSVEASHDAVVDVPGFRAAFPDFLVERSLRMRSLDVCSARLVYYAHQSGAFSEHSRVLCLDVADGGLVKYLLEIALGIELLVACSPNQRIAVDVCAGFSNRRAFCSQEDASLERLVLLEEHWTNILSCGVLADEKFDLIVMVGGVFGEAPTLKVWEQWQALLMPLLSENGVLIFDRHIPVLEQPFVSPHLSVLPHKRYVDTSFICGGASYTSRRHLFSPEAMGDLLRPYRFTASQLEHTAQARPSLSLHPLFPDQYEEWWMARRSS